MFLHGILGDSRYWQPQLAGLEGTSRAIAWDAPGVGGSEDPEPFFGVEGYVEALAGFLDFVDDAPAPDRVASLVLADTYAGWRGSLSEGEYQARRAAALEQLDIGGVPDDIPGVMHPRARPEARSTIDRMIADARPGGFEAMARAMLDIDSSDVLPSISVPTLLIWGEEDERSPLEVAQVFKAAIPGSQLVVISGAGHISSLEHPAAFNRAIRDFIAGS